MIRLTTALITLGVGMGIETTAFAQGSGCWWGGCNPEADLCRSLCGTDNPFQSNIGGQWAPGYVAPAGRGGLYMYVPRHSTRTHKNAPR
jgi:hypothetical protein